MIHIERAYTEHIASLAANNPEIEHVGIVEQLAVEMYQISEDAFAISSDDRILGVIGMSLTRPGCGNAWSMLATDLQQHSIGLTRAVLKVIEEVQKERDLRRMDMLVRTGNNVHIRWASFLGFEKEGTLRYFGPWSEDYDLMARYWV